MAQQIGESPMTRTVVTCCTLLPTEITFLFPLRDHPHGLHSRRARHRDVLQSREERCGKDFAVRTATGDAAAWSVGDDGSSAPDWAASCRPVAEETDEETGRSLKALKGTVELMPDRGYRPRVQWPHEGLKADSRVEPAGMR